MSLTPCCLSTAPRFPHLNGAPSLDPEAGAPRRLGGVVTVDVDTGLQPETGQTMQLVDDNEMVSH